VIPRWGKLYKENPHNAPQEAGLFFCLSAINKASFMIASSQKKARLLPGVVGIFFVARSGIEPETS
jgi:hypothetical protein